MSGQAVSSELFDEIRTKGIRALGFGHVAKIVMLDPDLTLEAKAIYAYFCSYTGSGHNTAFPSRDRILHDLDISKGRYYRHFSLLTENGYITVEQKAGDIGRPGFKHNIYTIENLPSKFTGPAPSGSSDAMKKAYDQIKNFNDISAAGYGTVPKSVMLSSVPICAKGIYAYFCVFSGENYHAMPSRDTILFHLNISHNAYNKYIHALLDADYIRKEQSMINGKFGNIVYYLNQISESAVNTDKNSENRVSDISEPQNRDTQNDDAPESISVFSQPQNEYTQKRDSHYGYTLFTDTQNQDINIPSTNKNKKNINNSKQSNNLNNISTERAIDYANNKEKVVSDILSYRSIPSFYTTDVSLLNSVVRYLTDWDERQSADYYTGENADAYKHIYKLFVETLSEMLISGSSFYIRGTKISSDRVLEALTENYLDFGELPFIGAFATLNDLPDAVCSSFLESAKARKITNVKAYMKTIIWTELQTSGAKGIADFLNSWDNK